MMIDITVQTPKIDIENPNRGEPGRDGIGIHYMGEINEYNELPLTAEEGDAYYWAGKLYIFKDDEFPAENKGIQYQGPQGPEGPQGPPGKQGIQGQQGIQGPPGEIAGLSGIATTEEAIAGESDTKAMTPLKTKEAVAAQVPEIMQETLQNKADLVDGKVPTNQLPEMDYVPNSEVGNAANKIPKYNASGHLVLPDGSEFWIG